MADLNLGVIGNCSYGALIDRMGRVVWCCMPRFDSDPVFCRLLDNGAVGGEDGEDARGIYEIELIGAVRSEQEYRSNTAILVTRLYDGDGNGIEITDYAPRFGHFGRTFRPTALIRHVRPLKSGARIRIRLRPTADYGATTPIITRGSNHIRYVGPRLILRLTTDAPLTYVLEETPFFLEEPITLFLGPDESLTRPVGETGRQFYDATAEYWRNWVRHLAVPLEWQDAVIRAAITLKLCTFEETGAIVAAMTTSIPEAAGSGRNWDYRFCWLRDAFFVVRALNRLGAVDILENYLRYLTNIVAGAEGDHLQPVYGIGLESRLTESVVEGLEGYRGMGPVRVGNQAHEHLQHDVYGNVVLAAHQAFIDKRLLRPAGRLDFERLEGVGERAYRLYNQPDAGMWELRTRAAVHTSSSLMCWAACDRLSSIAEHLALPEKARLWRQRADEVGAVIVGNSWNERLGSFSATFGGGEIDASLLLMFEVRFLDPHDPRFAATVAKVEEKLRRGSYLMRYDAVDDIGTPENAFNICTFWYIEALAAMGRKDEAREIFENMLACRNHVGLLSEDLDVSTGELWGNYPQTYSLVGIINSAIRLTRRWEEVL